jgi:hypothetical protein
MADGQLTANTPHGDIACPAKSVARITFGKKEGSAQKSARETAQVFGSFGRLTMELERLTADELIGRSESLGEVHLRRAAVREVRFFPARQD